MGDWKRRRSEPTFGRPWNPATTTDCYDDVHRMNYGMGIANEELPEEGNAVNNTIRSSWLTNTRWISSNQPHQPQSRSSTSCTGHVADDHSTLTSEIEHIRKQMLQVKRRLGPAAERCAETLRAYHGAISCTTTTTTTTAGRHEFVKARRICNPYEVLGEGHRHGFMNRSATKLANIDAALDFCLTRSSDILPRDNTFVFADLCGAPGGFSEYILWRCRRAEGRFSKHCRGYGMSLTGTNEHGQGIRWKLHDSFQHGKASRSQYRICHGVDGTGDIHRWENVESLQQTIYNDTPPDESSMNENDESERGRAHLVLADGGFDSQRDAENQEQVAQKLVVCEAAAALTLLRMGGTLVIKMFGFQTPVIRAVMRHFFVAFDSLVAFKPITSRPASAERYVVGFGFRGSPSGWNGQKWCSQIFLGRPCHLTNYAGNLDHEQAEMCVIEYLDEFDRDLCTLNLKACFAILSYLDCKSMQISKARSADQQIEDDDYEVTTTRINIASYKIAWRLAY